MGGMGFIESHEADCMISVLIDTHMLMAARENPVERFFYGSSACVYNADKQRDPNVIALKEEDAYPGGRERPQLGQHPDFARSLAGRPIRACATGWRGRIFGSATKSRRGDPGIEKGP